MNSEHAEQEAVSRRRLWTACRDGFIKLELSTGHLTIGDASMLNVLALTLKTESCSTDVWLKDIDFAEEFLLSKSVEVSAKKSRSTERDSAEWALLGLTSVVYVVHSTLNETFSPLRMRAILWTLLWDSERAEADTAPICPLLYNWIKDFFLVSGKSASFLGPIAVMCEALAMSNSIDHSMPNIRNYYGEHAMSRFDEEWNPETVYLFRSVYASIDPSTKLSAFSAWLDGIKP